MRLCVAKVAQFCANGAFERADSASAEIFFSGQIGYARRVFAIAARVVASVRDSECDARVISIKHSRGVLARTAPDHARTPAGRIFAGSARVRDRSRAPRVVVFVSGIKDV
jgi:hypothetical protein